MNQKSRRDSCESERTGYDSAVSYRNAIVIADRPFFIIVYIVVLFLYSTSLTWLVIASVPVYALLSLIVTPLFKKRLDEKFNAGAETSSF